MNLVNNTDSLSDDTGDDGIAEEDEEVQRTSSRANLDQVFVNWSFLAVQPTYHLYDAFPEVCNNCSCNSYQYVYRRTLFFCSKTYKDATSVHNDSGKARKTLSSLMRLSNRSVCTEFIGALQSVCITLSHQSYTCMCIHICIKFDT